MSDGIRLAVRLWLPSNSGVISEQFPGQTVWPVYTPGEAPGLAKCPAVLEYLPYRKDDITAVRDHRRHVWTASHGIAVARADLRGCGDSDGHCSDEYSPQELLDGRQLIAWLAGQSWTNGRIGLYGKSWGGFNGLQLAEMGCPGLAAVVSIYSSDDRFNSDIHYTGGCVIGTEALTWSSFMLAINSLPPSPAAMTGCRPGGTDSTGTGIGPGLTGGCGIKTPDDYWRRGSVRFGLNQLTVPVLLIGGWHDLYSDALLRLADRLPNTASCALLGPWSHDWPDTAAPGPRLAFTDECLRWWRLHLVGEAGVSQQLAPISRFRVFQRLDNNECDGVARPLAGCRQLSGAAGSSRPGCQFRLTGGQQLESGSAEPGPDCWSVDLSSRVECGFAYPEFLSFGDKDDAPDQAISNRMATVWRVDSLGEDLDLFGSAEASLNLQLVQANPSANPTASPTIGVRLSERDPDTGRETLVTWGVANLNLMQDTNGFATNSTRQFSAGRVIVRLRAATHRFARGRGVVLALSSGLWPLAWRCPGTSGSVLRVRVSAEQPEPNVLRLPLLSAEAAAEAAQLAKKDELLSAPPRLGPAPPLLQLSSRVGWLTIFSYC
uniref:PepX_C domain-containing protein n=1 Tax=Macrostomum lignano TaxID=282301 RepID=A0A1I8FTJ8_9PLAT